MFSVIFVTNTILCMHHCDNGRRIYKDELGDNYRKLSENHPFTQHMPRDTESPYLIFNQEFTSGQSGVKVDDDKYVDIDDSCLLNFEAEIRKTQEYNDLSSGSITLDDFKKTKSTALNDFMGGKEQSLKDAAFEILSKSADKGSSDFSEDAFKKMCLKYSVIKIADLLDGKDEKLCYFLFKNNSISNMIYLKKVTAGFETQSFASLDYVCIYRPLTDEKKVVAALLTSLTLFAGLAALIYGVHSGRKGIREYKMAQEQIQREAAETTNQNVQE